MLAVDSQNRVSQNTKTVQSAYLSDPKIRSMHYILICNEIKFNNAVFHTTTNINKHLKYFIANKKKINKIILDLLPFPIS